MKKAMGGAFSNTKGRKIANSSKWALSYMIPAELRETQDTWDPRLRVNSTSQPVPHQSYTTLCSIGNNPFPS